jgi:hypothetical protein
MTREEFEAALQTVYEVELGDAGDQWFALLAHDAAQREEIARLRAMRDRLAHRAMELTRRVDQLSNAATDLNEAVDEWVVVAKAEEAK